jgi:hypothetical protein
VKNQILAVWIVLLGAVYADAQCYGGCYGTPTTVTTVFHGNYGAASSERPGILQRLRDRFDNRRSSGGAGCYGCYGGSTAFGGGSSCYGVGCFGGGAGCFGTIPVPAQTLRAAPAPSRKD